MRWLFVHSIMAFSAITQYDEILLAYSPTTIKFIWRNFEIPYLLPLTSSLAGEDMAEPSHVN
jgi:hypothetical protein